MIYLHFVDDVNANSIHPTTKGPVAYNPIQIIDRLFKPNFYSYCRSRPFLIGTFFSLLGTCDHLSYREKLLEDDGSKSALKFVKTAHTGISAFANRRIKRGELILEEKVLFQYDPKKPVDFDELMANLSELEKEIFASLHDSTQKPGQLKTFYGIAQTNGFDIGTTTGIFPILTRVNHACRPNINYFWDKHERIMKVYAQQYIEDGQEIFNSYIFLLADTKTRQKNLNDSFKFVCKCQLCSRKNVSEAKLSDRRRNQILEFIEDLKKLEFVDPRKALKKLDKAFELLNLEDMMYNATYVGTVNELYLSVLVKYFLKKKEYIRIISDFAKYTIGNYTIAFGKAYTDRKYSFILKYLS